MPWGSCPLDVQSRGLAWPLPHHLVCVQRLSFPFVALRLVLYNCTSGYPVPFEDVCLLELRELYDKYHARVKAIGFSGHHLGIAVDVAAYAMGALPVRFPSQLLVPHGHGHGLVSPSTTSRPPPPPPHTHTIHLLLLSGVGTAPVPH